MIGLNESISKFISTLHTYSLENPKIIASLCQYYIINAILP